jgi:hypothetical protein
MGVAVDVIGNGYIANNAVLKEDYSNGTGP